MASVRYARTDDGLDIAYNVTGTGPDVVLIHGFTSHLDLERDSEWHRSWHDALASRFRLITFDKRGTGLSDRQLGHGSIEERARDLTAVIDAVGADRPAIVGTSEGTPMAIVHAAAHPHRIDKLVCYGGFAHLQPLDPGDAESLFDWVEANWGSGEVLGRLFIAGPDEAIETMARLERSSCTPQVAASVLRADLSIDVRPLLPLVRAPTLVIHNRDDPLVPAVCGRTLADEIPGAELVEFDDDFHCTGYSDLAAPRVDAALRFLLGNPEAVNSPEAQRVLASVLFTDIVDSTARIVASGDGAWATIRQRHDTIATECVERASGEFVKSTGDGILALFDGPSRALACARDIRDRVGELGLEIRSGVHTGEIERLDGDIGGIGVNIASRTTDLGDAGEICVTRTVRDLTLGSSHRFTDRGEHELKGVPGVWEIYPLDS